MAYLANFLDSFHIITHFLRNMTPNLCWLLTGKLDFIEFIVMAQDLVKQKGAGSGGANISANAVFGSRLAASDGEPFRSLESIISIADKVVFLLFALGTS